MQWPDLVAQLSYYMEQEQPDGSYTAAVPHMVNMAELQIYRDLDFLAASGQNTSLQTVAQSKILDLTGMTGTTITGGTPVAYPYPTIVQSIAARVGNRWIPFQLVSEEYLDLIWPDETITAPPAVGLALYCMSDDRTALIAPVPDKVYPLRVNGVWRPAPMSPANPTTWLGDNCPDLLFAAAMVQAMSYQRDVGAASEDPRTALSWKTLYDEAKRTALLEENLRKGLGPMYQPLPPAPLTKAGGA